MSPTAPPATLSTPEPALAALGERGLRQVAGRVAALLRGEGGEEGERGELATDGGSILEFEREISVRPLPLRAAPVDVWAVDGGQALVADARCFQVFVTRAARARFRDQETVMLEEGELRTSLLGGSESRRVLFALDIGLPGDTPADVNLVRDRWEWEAVARSVEDAGEGGLVLVDGDLQADWRLPPELVGRILRQAGERGVVVAGVTKHSSLSQGGAPLLGRLELEAEEALGGTPRWWAPVASVRRQTGEADVRVVAARLDPAARFAFRVDMPASCDSEQVLGSMAALADDAAFPGYPYPLSVADRLAACPPWLREEARLELDDLLARLGVSPAVRERAFTDRHRLMERG
jgi:NurA domain